MKTIPARLLGCCLVLCFAACDMAGGFDDYSMIGEFTSNRNISFSGYVNHYVFHSNGHYEISDFGFIRDRGTFQYSKGSKTLLMQSSQGSVRIHEYKFTDKGQTMTLISYHLVNGVQVQDNFVLQRL